MKTKIILLFLLAIFSCAINASNTDVRSAERNFQNAQNEISQLASKKKATEAKLQKAEADLQEASKKMEETKDKPKSLSYKNAVKKAEASQQKIAELEFSLQSIEADIDSKSEELRNYQQIILSAQQAKEDDAAAKKQAKEDAKLAKQREKDSIKLAKQQAKEEESDPKQQNNKYQEETTTIYKGNNKTNSEKASVTTSKDPSKKESEDIKLSFWEWLIAIGICIVFIWIMWAYIKRSLRCPKCGRWFAYDKDGVKVLNRQKDSNGSWNIVYEKRYHCRHCGHKHTEKGRLLTSKSTLPSDWY